MDNELGSEDRCRVELFVQENPDLKDELDWLLQSRLVPDTSLVFDNKEHLMKTSGAESINTTNYEEWLFLYTDNELTVEQKITVEKFAAAHPAIQEELELLQKTKFEPEQEIIFHNKELLYRKEEKVRVIAINWQKIAVAAALFIAISSIALIEFNKKDNRTEGFATREEVAVKKPTPGSSADQQKGEIIPNTNTKQIAADNNTDKINVVKETAQTSNLIVTTDKKAIALKEKNIRPFVLPVKENAPVVADSNSGKKGTNDLPEPKYNPNVNRNAEENNPIAQIDRVKEPLTISKENIQAPVVTPGNGQSLNHNYRPVHG